MACPHPQIELRDGHGICMPDSPAVCSSNGEGEILQGRLVKKMMADLASLAEMLQSRTVAWMRQQLAPNSANAEDVWPAVRNAKFLVGLMSTLSVCMTLQPHKQLEVCSVHLGILLGHTALPFRLVASRL
jgi:hypothetical protein